MKAVERDCQASDKRVVQGCLIFLCIIHDVHNNFRRSATQRYTQEISMSIVTIRVCILNHSSVQSEPKSVLLTERGIHQQPSSILGRLPFSRHVRMHRTPQRW